MSKIIIITGSSGSGKTTIAKSLLSIENFNLKFSISACSRRPRTGEIDGKDYIFLDSDSFKKKIKSKDFLEWEEVYENNFYGTLKSSTETILNNGYNILFDVDVKGALSLKNHFKNRALFIFVKAPSIEVLKNRLLKRQTESQQELNLRIGRMSYEMQMGKKSDLTIVNNNLEDAIADVSSVIRKFLDK